MIHGKVHVNGKEYVSYWGHRDHPQGFNQVYLFRAEGLDSERFLYEYDFAVVHNPADGLPVLLSKVFTELGKRVP